MSQTVIIRGIRARDEAHRLVTRAPEGSVCKISAPRRSNDQNALMWSLLSELARAKPEGRELPAETWKCLVMSEAGFETVWERSLDGRGMVPVGFKSSRLTKGEFSDVIEAIYAYGAEHGVQFMDQQVSPGTGVGTTHPGDIR